MHFGSVCTWMFLKNKLRLLVVIIFSADKSTNLSISKAFGYGRIEFKLSLNKNGTLLEPKYRFQRYY